jgi:UDP-N-acetylmuramate dehydrogenase
LFMVKEQISSISTEQMKALTDVFKGSILANEPLARWTSARVGGMADALLEVHSSKELAEAASWLWKYRYPFLVIGGGSNILVSDQGYRGVVLLNLAKQVRFNDDPSSGQATVWAESGVNLGSLARQAAQKGFSGLEWAAGIPGTLGGAVVGNAGAHGGDMAGNLISAEILHQDSQGEVELWSTGQLDFGYRTSKLKPKTYENAFQPWGLVLSVLLRLERSDPQSIKVRMDDLVAYRHKTQPPGASMGSMFKNPPGDYAGRLIEAAGLKGTRIGKAEISPTHANFFVNQGDATANDIFQLIKLARDIVLKEFGIDLELEIQLVGDWSLEETASS